MKKVLNIFSRKKSEKQTKQEKRKIIADYREKNSLVISELIKLGINTEIKNLKVADYLVKNIAIERKTSSDFINSMINKRLFQQLEELKQYKNHFLIIEGNLEKTKFQNKNALKGFLLSILLNFKVPIIFSKDEKETALYLSILSRKKKKEVSIRASKKFRNKKEQLQYILEGFPGIGPKTAKKLLNNYKTLQNILSQDINELKNLIGKKAETFDLLKQEY